VLAVNVVSLLSCVLCGLGAYMLGRRVGLSGPAALLCGIIFAFSPPRFFRFDQLHLTVVQWIPFSLASLHAYLDGGRRRDLRLAAGFFTLQALSSGHGVVFLVVAVVILLGYRVALGEPIAVVRRARDLGALGALLLLPAALVFLPYRVAQIEVGLKRGLGGWAVPESFIASPTHVHTAIMALFTRTDPNLTASAYLFPGYAPLLLALVALAWWPPRPAQPASVGWPHVTIWNWIAMAANAGALAAASLAIRVAVAGPVRLYLHSTPIFTARSARRAWIVAAVFAAWRTALRRRAPFAAVSRLAARGLAWRAWGEARRRSPVPVYGFVLLLSIAVTLGPPASLWPLVYSLPVFNFIRVPSRFTILGLLALAVLAGIGFDRLVSRFAPKARRTSSLIVGALLVVEFAAIPLPAVPYHLDIPAADRWVARQPTPFVIAEVPVTTSERLHSSYMLHAMAHWQKTVHGYSGIRPALHEVLYDELRSFPGGGSLQHLVGLGVTHVIVHTSWFPSDQLPQLEDGLRQFAPWLTLVYADPTSSVYAIHRPVETSRIR
jgi:hypothetical protein